MTAIEIIEPARANVVVELNTVNVIVEDPAPNKIVEFPQMGPQGPGGALGLYATIIDTTKQDLISTTLAQALVLGTTLASRGVSVVDGSKIKFELAGVYKIMVSLQMTNFSNAVAEANFFFKKNSQWILDTNTRIDLQPRKSQTVPYHDFFTVEVQFEMQKNEYIELFWVATHIGVAVETLPANGTHPRAPGVILNVAQILYAQAGVPIGGNSGDIIEKTGAGNYETGWSNRLTLLEQRVTAIEQSLS
jgi:hypothetical protein